VTLMQAWEGFWVLSSISSSYDSGNANMNNQSPTLDLRLVHSC
jgi:hypothetical protein